VSARTAQRVARSGTSTRTAQAGRAGGKSGRRPQRGASGAVVGRTKRGAPPARPRAPELRTLVFVYGTLLVGETNHRLLTGAQLICEASTAPRFQLHDLGAYPGMVRRGKHAVAGEVYEVGEAMLASLDRLEDHPRFYRRTSIVLDGGRRVQTYLLRRDQVEGYPIIASGSWRARGSKGTP
jgi:gamma-glutamylaminecyclotransferase